MKVACQICDEWMSSDIVRHFSEDFNDKSIISKITEMAPTFEDTVQYCELFNKEVNCGEIFFPIFTEEGLCYTFNSMDTIEVVTDQ